MILSLPTAKCHRRQAPGNTDKLETDSAEREREIEIERWREIEIILGVDYEITLPKQGQSPVIPGHFFPSLIAQLYL